MMPEIHLGVEFYVNMLNTHMYPVITNELSMFAPDSHANSIGNWHDYCDRVVTATNTVL